MTIAVVLSARLEMVHFSVILDCHAETIHDLILWFITLFHYRV